MLHGGSSAIASTLSLNTATHKIESQFVKIKPAVISDITVSFGTSYICLCARRQESSLSSKGRRENQSWLPLCSQKISKGYALEECFSRSQFGLKDFRVHSVLSTVL